MLKLHLFVIVCLSSLLSVHAQNLVANGNFEDRNICSEFKVTCAPEAWFFIPSYIQIAKMSDSNYSELLSLGYKTGTGNLGNFIYTKLLCSLLPDVTYQFSVSLQMHDKLDFEKIDIWFGSFEPGKTTKSIYTETPSFTITPKHIFSTEKGWLQLNYSFIAKGGEKYLMIGNLSPLKNQIQQKPKRYDMKWPPVLCNIDNVVLIAQDKKYNACREYDAIVDQVYRQNRRHPPGLIEEIDMNEQLVKQLDTINRKLEVKWVIVDTPPTLTKEAPPLNDTLIIPDVLFRFNSSELNPQFSKKLDSLLQKLQMTTFTSLEIAGHTDNRGADEYNKTLSLNRAIRVQQYLLFKGLAAKEKITVAGYGEQFPRATNTTQQGRLQNRRVEIILKRNQ